MKTATVHLESISPYSQSRHYANDVEKLEKESANDYEKRTWLALFAASDCADCQMKKYRRQYNQRSITFAAPQNAQQNDWRVLITLN